MRQHVPDLTFGSKNLYLEVQTRNLSFLKVQDFLEGIVPLLPFFFPPVR